MRSTSRTALETTLILGAAIAVSGVFSGGCSGSLDNSPTNAKNSQYVNTGDTVADKVGQARTKARLPHGGQQQ